MRQNRSNYRTSITRRKAMAPLEFVMALPILFLLMVAITWLGFYVIGQTEVLVEARNKTWKRRFEDASNKPLYFPILIGLYDAKLDFVTENVSQRVDVSPIFDDVRSPEAAHTILAGSWDHQAMGFKEPPDLKLMAIAAAVGTFGNVLDAGASLNDPLGLLKEIGEFASAGKQTEKNSQSESANVGEGGEDSGPGSGSGTVPSGQPQTPDQGEAKTKEDKRKKKKELQQRRDELGGQIIYTLQGEKVIAAGGEMKQVQDEIDRLERERNSKSLEALREQDEEKKKQLTAEADRLDRQVKLQEIKYKRLEAEFLDVDAELKALD